ncbi:prolipoprotein diacylglyceryl transferase [Parafilimonas terrae]|uniref:Prolipoprotein diacylglyceryltransferase n=1 Tax=Parafilimonas terrae TaxID=1465490 RepID=A0A1I5YC05_9BACT|nr:prolipoprotein diacylglyceryl transferase family protein [Parafilimonas terrae]SFQ41713.1 Prolipoprotein diacylglyceryltransferase [Parafilimonas terrae]
MYPNLYYLIKELSDISLPFLKAISTAGFFMALAFVPAAWLWEYELKYKEKTGELTYRTEVAIAEKSINIKRILFHFLLGFTGGFKLIGLFTGHANQNNADYFFSLQGNVTAGIICGALWALITFYIQHKQHSVAAIETVEKIYPHEYVPHAILVAALSGIIGAKIFGVLEDWDNFISNPVHSFFSSEGYAFLGGFIVATFAMWLYHYKFGVQRMRMADALAPALILGYSSGRLGCHIAGDGDWGINNIKPNPFGWLPDWLWHYDYPHNILRKGIYMQGCTWDDYCYKLAVPVYPTPLYELAAGLIIVLILLFALRHEKLAGRVSAYCLMLMGIERFLIEKIRVDIRYNFLGMHPTQAEMLAVLCFCCGLLLYFIAPKLNANKIK